MKTQITHQDRDGGLASPRTVRGKQVYSGIACRVHDAQSPLEYTTGPEFRRRDEVMSIAKQLPGMPLRVEHDQDGPAIGTVLSARVDADGNCVVDFGIDGDPQIARSMVRKRPELSLGYNLDHLDSTGHQIGIAVFELSIVSRGRCGSACATKTDSCCSSCASAQKADTSSKKPLPVKKKWIELDPEDDPLSQDPDYDDDDDEDFDQDLTEDSAAGNSAKPLTDEQAAMALARRTRLAWTK
jgi:hypothetical protein